MSKVYHANCQDATILQQESYKGGGTTFLTNPQSYLKSYKENLLHQINHSFIVESRYKGNNY